MPEWAGRIRMPACTEDRANGGRCSVPLHRGGIGASNSGRPPFARHFAAKAFRILAVCLGDRVRPLPQVSTCALFLKHEAFRWKSVGAHEKRTPQGFEHFRTLRASDAFQREYDGLILEKPFRYRKGFMESDLRRGLVALTQCDCPRARAKAYGENRAVLRHLPPIWRVCRALCCVKDIMEVFLAAGRWAVRALVSCVGAGCVSPCSHRRIWQAPDRKCLGGCQCRASCKYAQYESSRYFPPVRVHLVYRDACGPGRAA